MGSYSYLILAAFIAASGVLLLSQRKDANRADVEVGRIHMKQEARNAAVTGFNVSLRKLAADTGAWLVPANYETGPHDYGVVDGPTAAYQTVVTIVDTVGGDTLDIVATGTKPYIARDGSGQDTTHVIEARIARGILVDEAPPAARSAIISDNRMRIHGDFNLQSVLPGVNADIHTNDVLRTDGNSFLVEGYGTYSVGERVGQPDNFQPPNDWNGIDPNIFQRPPIPIPVWDHAAFAAAAQANGYYTTNDLTIDGDALAAASITTVDQFAETVLGLPMGDYGLTEDAPLLVMVGDSTKELRFVNNVVLSGYIQFGSLGHIEVDPQGNPGGVILDYTLDIPNQTAYTHAGIFTTQGMDVSGNATIQATVYAGGQIRYLGGVTLYGGQIADETTFQGGGTINVYWVGAGASVLEFFDGYDEPIGPVIIAYAEW